MLKAKTAFIVQARLGSTRLPHKILLPFYKDNTILDIIIDRITRFKKDTDLIIATSTSKDDDRIELLCKNKNIKYFRGSENDVLQRFIDTAEHFGIDDIIRVCSDNPFFDVEGTLKLLNFSKEFDYTAYKITGDLPSIKSHLGLWGEVVSLVALRKVKSFTNEFLFSEHVTNYIYSNRDKFKIRLLKAPDNYFNADKIRLTVDDIQDFEFLQKIYKELDIDNRGLDINSLYNFLNDNKEYLQKMNKQITKYNK
ncbi:MAG: glycosyl transferase family 2 [Bacteroidales bacterium]|nr:glycosyl transferase family 2 [Bacteroidales bacterium]